jgi:hypothetical protein
VNRTHPFARKLTAAALTIGVGVGVTMVVASPAQASTTCTLSIGGQDENGRYPVFVNCSPSSNGVFGLYGSDPLFDDFRGGPFYTGAVVTRGVLNEDDSFFDREDEIYAIVAPLNTKTNTVVRHF